MIEALKKLIIKHGGTYDRYDNTELELLRRLCDALNLPYDKYMDVSQLFNLVADNGVLPEGGESGGGSEGGEELTWENIINNDKASLVPGSYGYVAKNGIDMYYSSSNYNYKGLWHKNLQTGIVTKIYALGYTWQYFYEDSKGNVYVGGSNGGTGILCLNGGNVVGISEKNSPYVDIFFEDSKGNIYAVANAGGNGVFYLNGENITLLVESCSARYFYEDKSGNVYLYYKDVYHLDEDSATKIYTKNETFQDIFENSKGDVYLSTYYSKDNLYISGKNVTEINSIGSISSLIEDSKGNTYLSTYSSSYSGLYHANGPILQKIYELGYYWDVIFEDSKGNVYINSRRSNGGILYIENLTATRIVSVDSRYTFYEDSKGNLYATGSGVYHINKNIATKLVDTSPWSVFFESSKGDVYLGQGGSNGSQVLYLNGETATYVSCYTYSNYFFESSNGDVYVSSYAVPPTNAKLGKLEGSTCTEFVYSEVTK